MSGERALLSAQKALRDYLRVRGGRDKALIVYDGSSAEVAEALIAAAKTLQIEVIPLKITPTGGHGFEPDAETAKMMKSYPVVICPTVYSLTHTAAARAARDNGARVATMPGITLDIFERCLSVPPECLRDTGNQWMEVLLNASELRVTDKNGSDFTLRYGRYSLRNDDGCIWAPKIGNLPAGEVFFAPDPESVNGVAIIDGSVSGQGWSPNAEVCALRLEKGRAADFEGPRAKELREALAAKGDDAFLVAEFGIGTNPDARIGGNLLEDEKVKGSIHIAFGNNKSFGGDNAVAIHIDCVIMTPTLRVGGRDAIRDGVWFL